MDLGLTGRVALITGGSRGIGRVTALTLAREGCAVSLCARTAADLDDVVGELRAVGVPVHGVLADVRDDFQDAVARLDIELVEHRRNQPRRRHAGQRPAVGEPAGDHRLLWIVGDGQVGVGHERMARGAAQNLFDLVPVGVPNLLDPVDHLRPQRCRRGCR